MRILKTISIATCTLASQLDYEGSFVATALISTSKIEPLIDSGPARRKKKAEDAPETTRMFSSPKFRTKRNNNWNARYETDRFATLESLHESGTLVDLFSKKYRRSMATLNSRLQTLVKKSKQRSAACWLKQSQDDNRNGGIHQRYRTEKERIDRWQPDFTETKDGLANYFIKFAETIRDSFGDCSPSQSFSMLNKLDLFRLKVYFRYCADFPESLPQCKWVGNDSDGNAVSKSTHGKRPFKATYYMQKYRKTNAKAHAEKFGLKFYG